MTTSELAYHTVVHAVEAASGWTPQSRFSSAVSHVINGHLPYDRYLTAGRARKGAKTGLDAVEHLVEDWLATDLNPAIQLIRSMNQTQKALQAYNAYNASANLGVCTAAEFSGDSSGPSALIARRNLCSPSEDPELCRIATMSVLASVMKAVICNERERLTPKILTLSDIAIHLGITRSASADVAFVFEVEGYIPIGAVARTIGCHQRTLERRLRQEGLTAEVIRTATRLIRATKRLRGLDSLTTIALEEDFSDQAQMTRAFRSSTGLSPSMLRMLS